MHMHIICSQWLAVQKQELYREEELQYDYVTTKGVRLLTSKVLRPPTTDEGEGQYYDSVIDDPLPPIVQQGYMKVDTSSLQPQSIYDDMVQPQSIYEDLVQPQSIYDDIVLPD